MRWDVGPQGLALLVGVAVAVAAFARLLFRGAARPVRLLLVAVAVFAVCVLVSEVWFGWATEADLQPNIDGVSWDEVLLLAVVPAVLALLVVRALHRRHPPRR